MHFVKLAMPKNYLQMKENLYENDYLRGWVEGGIMFGVFKPIDTLNLPEAEECVKMRLGITDKVSYPLLVDLKELKFVPKKTRDYFASPEACQYVSACALLTKSLVNKMMSDIFIESSRPLVPTRVFTNKQKAMKWLRQYVNKN